MDVCIANEEDADKALGIKSSDTDVEFGKLNKEEYVFLAKEICERFGCKYFAITLRENYSAGVNGWSAMLYDFSEGKAYFSRKYGIQIVDCFGDSFMAGLIYCLTTGKNNQDVIEFAAAASCLKYTIEENYNCTAVEDVQNLMKHGGNGRVRR